MALVAYLLLLLSMPLFGVIFVRRHDQAWRDRNRQTYILTFPAETSTEQITAWMYSISGTLRRGPMRFFGVPSMAFELWANGAGLTHRLRIPWQQADYVIAQLRSLVPGIRVTPDDSPPVHRWRKIAEFGEKDPKRSLRILSPEALSASILASVQALGKGEEVLVQWVISPAIPEKLPTMPKHTSGRHTPLLNGFVSTDKDEVNDRRGKLSEPNLLAVMRVAAKAKTDERAKHLIYRVKAALSGSRGPHNGFVQRRMLSRTKLYDRVKAASAGVTFPAQLSASELVALIAWPIGQPHVAGLPSGASRHLPVTEAVPRDGRIIGRSNWPGNERPIAISVGNSSKHLHIVGPTGVGKTILLANLIAQDMGRGSGVVVMESKGDLFHEALTRVPRSRLQDVIILDVTDIRYPVGFNILQGNPQVVASEIQTLFEYLYPNDVRGVRVRQGLYHAIMTLMTSTNATQPMTFADIGPLCAPRADQVDFSDQLIRGVVHDEELAAFWQEISNLPRQQRDQFFGPLMGRIWQLNNRREVRNIIGQSSSAFDMREVITGNKILLVNLAGLGTDVSSLVGSLLLNSLWTQVQGGAANPGNPTFLYLDEFQEFLRLPISPEAILAKARSMGLAMNLAHQHLGQLPPELRSAVLANARSKVVFQTSSEDARIFAREFGSQVTEHDFMNQAQYEVIARIATDSGVSGAITATTSAPSKTTGSGNLARAHSRTVYARPVSQVEDEIRARRHAAPQQARRRPPIGQTT